MLNTDLTLLTMQYRTNTVLQLSNRYFCLNILRSMIIDHMLLERYPSKQNYTIPTKKKTEQDTIFICV